MTKKGSHPYLAPFAQVVRNERQAAGLTLSGMGDLLSVCNAKTVWQWENARKDGRHSILRACFEGSLVGAALAQRILKQVYP
jgi:transcriptional regulator with XRE-family HTH domain